MKVFTSIYVPKDRSEKYPFLITRTPYSVGPYGVDQYKTSLGPSEHFQKSGYIFVYQDARGRYMSEGEFQQVRPFIPDKRSSKDVDESTDTWDTIDWLLKNIPGHNGRAGMVGVSQPRLPRGRKHHEFPLIPHLRPPRPRPPPPRTTTWATTCITTARSCWERTSASTPSSSPARGSPRRPGRPWTSIRARPTCTTSSSASRPSPR